MSAPAGQLEPPEPFDDAILASGEVVLIGAEREVQTLCRRFLRRRWLLIGWA